MIQKIAGGALERIELLLFSVLYLVVFVSTSPAVFAQESFYKGKTIRIVVGFSAGGGFDTYSRTLARHMGKHITGNPTLVVENMTGAGSLIAANHLYKVARPDGLTIGIFHGNQITAQVLGGQGIEFDARKFDWLGAPGQNHDLCLLSKESGIANFEQWTAAKTPVKLGGSAPGTTTDDGPKVLKAALNLPLRLVTGYKGTADIRIAVEGGELDGLCGLSWASAKATWRKGLESGKINVVLQNAPQSHPELTNVPLAINFARTEEARQLIHNGIHNPSMITYSYSVPPATPKERLQILQRAFADTVKDPEFLAEAKKANLEVNPVPGEEVERIVHGYFKLDPGLLARLKEILR
jgi:tripartite-type tricarboxylate transporter receptor subunit TctC